MSNTNEFQFNPAQLSTWENARETARKLSEGPIVIGGGVLPETGDPRTSGLYVPDWFGGPAQFREPSRVDAEGNKHLFIHFRFRNGAEGMNAGLVADRFRRYPTSPLYALRSLAEEAAMLAGEQTD